MSESEPKTAASTDHQLEVLVAEVESKFIDAEDALSELRHAIRQLKAYRPPAQASQAEPDAPAGPSYDLPKEWALDSSAASQGEAGTMEAAARSGPRLDDETVGMPFWSGPRKHEPEPEPQRQIADYGMDSTSEGSWPIARPAQERVEPTHVEQSPADEAPEATEDAKASASADEDDESRREEVARIVAQMREGGEGDEEPQSAEEPAAEDDEEANRRDVAKMVADLRDSAEVEAEPTENGNGPSVEDEDARREEVARMVAELRSGGLDTSGAEEDVANEGDESKREDVADMVAQMRAELESGAPADETEAGASDEEVRDEVRRAVEAARAEMASGYVDKSEESGDADKRFSFPDWQSTHMEPSGPPVIVIKDSEGRVELARVYDTLSRVNCDENAALLNYTPHSVTVGLNAKASVPEVEALTEAVKAVFGRAAVVDSDGVRVNVQIGKDLKGKDSAA